MESSSCSEQGANAKKAACLECRKSKVKCIRNEGSDVCRKCEAAGASCVIPPYHVGRYKGVKNKRTGLEKAISQVEKAIKKSRNGTKRDDDDQQVQALENLLRQTEEVIEIPKATPVTANHIQRRPESYTSNITNDVPTSEAAESVTDVTINNADNPLELLAVASSTPMRSSIATTPATAGVSPSEQALTSRNDDLTQTFFKSIRCKLDNSRDIDPIYTGLATVEDAKRLFNFFHEQLAHTRWGMDSRLHTWEFVRSRSAFLLTSIMAVSALFLSDAAALSIRLRNHVQSLLQTIVAKRYRSVEIVLGLMVNVPWLIPGEQWAADDDTCYYISLAQSIALDLSLNRIIVPSSTLRPAGFLNQIARAECIDSSRALIMDGFTDTSPTSELGRRLLRTRERTWLALFNLDRGVCLARGRPPIVPASSLVASADSWHVCDIADPQDGALVSTIVLRRDFVGLVDSIRNTCNTDPMTIGSESMAVRTMRDKIETFFGHWFDTWKFQVQQADGRIPPYVELVASHTKLAAYCNVINHQTVPPVVKKFFRTAGVASAVNVLKVAAEAESRLRSMPNNTVIMVSFAAFFVIGLSDENSGSSSLVTENTKALVEEVAGVLERIGTTPPHRRGASTWFGKHIKTVAQTLKTKDSGINPTPKGKGLTNQYENSSYILDNPHGNGAVPEVANFQPQDLIPEDFAVFDMTNDEIINAISSSHENMEAMNPDILYDETQFLDWFETWSAV